MGWWKGRRRLMEIKEGGFETEGEGRWRRMRRFFIMQPQKWNSKLHLDKALQKGKAKGMSFVYQKASWNPLESGGWDLKGQKKINKFQRNPIVVFLCLNQRDKIWERNNGSKSMENSTSYDNTSLKTHFLFFQI